MEVEADGDIHGARGARHAIQRIFTAEIRALLAQEQAPRMGDAV